MYIITEITECFVFCLLGGETRLTVSTQNGFYELANQKA